MNNEKEIKDLFIKEALKSKDYYKGFEVGLWVKAKHYGLCELMLEHMVKHPDDTTAELLGYIDVVVKNGIVVAM